MYFPRGENGLVDSLAFLELLCHSGDNIGAVVLDRLPALQL